MPFYSRKSPRLQGFDYTSQRYYFVTLCTHQHKCIFGAPNQLNTFGQIAMNDLIRIPQHVSCVRVDKCVVMPNHIHAIIVIEGNTASHSISQIIALYKTGVTKQLRSFRPNIQVWQRSFYDHIIRNCKSYEEIWTYIDNNPLKWELDKFYIAEQKL